MKRKEKERKGKKGRGKGEKKKECTLHGIQLCSAASKKNSPAAHAWGRCPQTPAGLRHWPSDLRPDGQRLRPDPLPRAANTGMHRTSPGKHHLQRGILSDRLRNLLFFSWWCTDGDASGGISQCSMSLASPTPVRLQKATPDHP